MAITSSLTRVFSRNSVFVGTVFFGAFAFSMGFDVATQNWWDKHNKPKQWKDIRAQYD
ncbi:BQ5605_C005g03582 [Microbotryum silenes-dioicae]|nr:BQ5605_C005g03582 [Microbotryum silenes-dioicae]